MGIQQIVLGAFNSVSADLLGNLYLTLSNPTPAANDLFGISVAVSDTYAVVGAMNDDTGATDSGSIYVFDIVTGALVTTIPNPAPTAYDQFGINVATIGNYVVAGVYWEKISTVATAGAVYIFNATTGALLNTLQNPTPASWDMYGKSIAVNSTYVLVGAGQDDNGATNTGVAYLYNISTGALVRTITNPLTGINGNGTQFGNSVAMNERYLVIGSNAGAGTAYVYDVVSGTLLATLTDPTAAASTQFGYGAIAVNGEYVAVSAYTEKSGGVSAGAVYVFNAATGALINSFVNPSPDTGGDQFGYAVSIDGNTLLVGANYDDTTASNSGSVYLFNIATGALIKTVANPTPTANGQFGISVASTGSYFVVGAALNNSAGTAYIYK